jgi:dTDP-glucose 4,6-dehydratase
LKVAELICRIVDRIAPIAGSRAKLITFVPDRPGHDFRYAINADKSRRELDWRPRAGFEDGLEETVRWYLENRAWWEPLRQNVYRGERLGLLDAQG